MFPSPDYPSKFEPSYWAQVGEWIQDTGSRYLLATQNTDAFPDHEALVDHIWSGIRLATGGFRVWSGRYGMSYEALDSRVHDKAAFLLTTFVLAVPRGAFKGRFKRPFTVEECRRGGKAGGAKGVRPSKLLERLKALPEDLTGAEIADELECSERQVWRLRAQLKKQAMQAEVDELIPLTELVEKVTEEPDEFPETDEEYVPVIVRAYRQASFTIEAPDWDHLFDDMPTSKPLTLEQLAAQWKAQDLAAIDMSAFAGIEL